MKLQIPKASLVSLVFLLLAALVVVGHAEVSDGTHEAIVTTPSGPYTVSVEVSGGEVDCVNWPNGGCMHLYGADIDEDASERRPGALWSEYGDSV